MEHPTTPLGIHDGAKKILVAEDNLVNQKLVLRLLSVLGYTADLAQNGAEALELVESGAYCAVLMDIHMPVMDGIAATKAIRNMQGDSGRVPIIAVTANTVEGARQSCLAAGMNDFLTKPIQRDKFAETLHRWTAAA